jgi:hypothetical protein
MTEGREMVSLIAVFLGWVILDRTAVSPSGSANSRMEKDGDDNWLQYYSSDVYAAWAVWEKLVELERFPTVHQGPDENGSGNYFFICVVNPVIEIVSDSFPVGICKIALLARLQMEGKS